MKALFKLAVRNVFRNRRRSTITILVISVGIFAFLAMDGFISAFSMLSVNNLKKLDTAHIKVFDSNYWDNRYKEPLDYTVKNYKQIEDKIRKIDGVEGLTHRINFNMKIYYRRNEMPCRGIGIDTKDGDSTVFELNNSIIKGEYQLEGNYALIGKNLADLFDLDIGGFLTLEFRDKNDVYDALQVQIAGIFNTGHPELDKNVVYLPFDLVQERLEMRGEVSELAFKLKSERKLKRIIGKIQSVLPGSVIAMSWEKQAADYLKFSKMKNMGGRVMISILMIIVIAGIWNTMLMSVLEREREIGMMMALGMRKSRVRWLFLTEGAVIGVIGAVIGIVLGFAFMLHFSANGINISALMGDRSAGYIVKDIVYGSVQLFPFIQGFFLGVVISLAASFVPARNASKRIPAEVLRRY